MFPIQWDQWPKIGSTSRQTHMANYKEANKKSGQGPFTSLCVMFAA